MSVRAEQSSRPRYPSPSSRRRRGALTTGAAALCGSLAVGLLAPAAASAEAPPRARGGVVQQELDALVRADGFPGALAAVRTQNGRVRHYTAGVGDLETGRKVPVDGRVRIASNTKTFTATVLLQLVQEGRVDLDAPVEAHLPGLVRGEGIDGHRITVRQVLQHTSGLPDYARVIYTDPTDPTEDLHTYFEPRALLDMGLSQPALFAPGTSWAYSNTNYAVAGLIVQAVTGRPVGEEITRRIIEPLHLEDTYWPGEGEQTIRGEHPRGYAFPRAADGTVVQGPLVDVTDQDPSAPWAAGALVSTPGDLLAFFTALVEGELLSPEMLEQMQTTVPVPADQSLRATGEEYGLGLQTFPLSCGGIGWTHGGDISGTETRGAVTEDGRGVMIAVTATPPTVEAYVHVEEAVDAAICR
ncbi:serine hydrolase [Quadrisphaera sp. DSM 44207]|uniref:serine hydrolase domain-containing protein n=1 Tax=Quadrisphaera sp. DSM 44207 TaxID=1881057 RepID=UPI000891045C|nr:serine hydrolase domain-containing protein [Quadrisphaera sp. DSM 44207]SDQ15599.1 D-alanyl-D-alanine carboxypeptidase [Quadrisphaera sp. DSM 44207]